MFAYKPPTISHGALSYGYAWFILASNPYLFINTDLGSGCSYCTCHAAFHRDWLSQVKTCWRFVLQRWLKKLNVYLIVPATTSWHALRQILFIYLHTHLTVLVIWKHLAVSAKMHRVQANQHSHMFFKVICHTQILERIILGCVTMRRKSKPSLNSLATACD